MKNPFALFSMLLVVALTGAGCGDKGQSPADALVEQNDARAQFSNGIVRMIESEVDLSESQKVAFKQLADELASDITANREKRKAEMRSFATAFKNASLSEADLDNVVPHFFPKERHAFMRSLLVQAHQLLTPEQRGKIADKLNARHDEMTAKREKREKEKKQPSGLMRGGFMLHKLARDLDLTDSQKAALTQIATDFQSKLGNEEPPMRRAQMEAFIREFRKDKMDEAVINQGAAQLDAKQAEIRSAMKDAIKSIHALLTPEQRAKASEKLLQMAERRAKFEDEHRGRGKFWGNHRRE